MTTKHTPCGCFIEPVNNCLSIRACSLHAIAPELLEVLEDLLREIHLPCIKATNNGYITYQKAVALIKKIDGGEL